VPYREHPRGIELICLGQAAMPHAGWEVRCSAAAESLAEVFQKETGVEGQKGHGEAWQSLRKERKRNYDVF
jgi:hypothetical protein